MNERHPHSPSGPIWVPSSRLLFPPLGDSDERSDPVDLIVIGAGIVGVTTALLAARAGRRVALLEGRRIGSGTTGHSTAKVTALQGTRYQQIEQYHGYDAARRYAQAQRDALDWMREQIESLGIDCGWATKTAVTYSTSTAGAGIVEREAEMAAAVGLEVELTDDLPLPYPISAAVCLPLQAQFDPQAYVEGLAMALAQLPNATIYENSRVIAVRGRGPYRVVTDRGEITAPDVVVATLLPITDRAFLFARAQPSMSYTIAVEVIMPSSERGETGPSSASAAHGSSRIIREFGEGMYINVEQPTRSLRMAGPYGATSGQPSPDGVPELLLIGGQGSLLARNPRPSAAIDTLVGWARKHFAVRALRGAWSAHDYQPADHLPWIGPTSSLTPRVFTATGFQKWGMTMGTAAAHILADHILSEPRDSGSFGVFHPTRLAGRAWGSVAQFNLDVAARLARDWVGPNDSPDADGRGRRYRDGIRPYGEPDPVPRGSALPVVCTHLGGICRWNDTDHTWDCPLHGSRFDQNGTVVTGPATRPLHDASGT